jgi:adenylate cyclase
MRSRGGAEEISAAERRYLVRRLIKPNYVGRLALYGYAAMVAGIILHHRGASPWVYVLIGLSLGWPTLAYHRGRRSRDPKATETTHFVIDALITGGWCSLTLFHPWFSVVIIIGQNALCLMTGGARLYLKGILATGVGALFAGAATGFELNADPIPVATVMSVVLMLAYINVAASVSYAQARMLRKTYLELKEKKQQIEDIALKIAKYLSPQIYRSIFEGEREVKIETRQRKLTVFFSDIAGFTSKTESTPLVELESWLNTYLQHMTDIALRHDGTVDKFIGDAVMVFFGDPRSRGAANDAVRCLEMALEMRACAKALGVDVRIGVNTGDCVVGNFGSEQHMEYTIIGGAVNLAARLESRSEPGGILISDTTWALVADRVRCRPGDTLWVKGIDRAITTHWVEGLIQQDEADEEAVA